MPSIVEQITKITAPLAASMGLELWGVEFAPGGRSVLRVFVEGSPIARNEASAHNGDLDFVREDQDGDTVAAEAFGGVNIDQCAELSRLLGLTLDVDDILPGAYVLEVSSPGLDRTFFSESQLAGALGRTVEIQYADSPAGHSGRCKFRGLLEEADPKSGFALRLEDANLPGEKPELLRFAFAELKKAKQVFVPPKKERPGKGAGKKGKTPPAGAAKA